MNTAPVLVMIVAPHRLNHSCRLICHPCRSCGYLLCIHDHHHHDVNHCQSQAPGRLPAASPMRVPASAPASAPGPGVTSVNDVTPIQPVQARRGTVRPLPAGLASGSGAAGPAAAAKKARPQVWGGAYAELSDSPGGPPITHGSFGGMCPCAPSAAAVFAVGPGGLLLGREHHTHSKAVLKRGIEETKADQQRRQDNAERKRRSRANPAQLETQKGKRLYIAYCLRLENFPPWNGSACAIAAVCNIENRKQTPACKHAARGQCMKSVK